MKLSIVIASRNRSESLRNFLEHIVTQVVPHGVDWKVLVVDNNSTDETKALTGRLIEKDPQRFRYLFEGRPGKSISLNTGVRQASGEILVFTDDDCLPDPNWLATIADEFAADPALAALGGRVELFDQRDRSISVRTCREKTVVSTTDQLFSLMIGCNMAIHRRVFDLGIEFDPFLGPGTKLPAMEDLDFLYRVFREKFKIVYSPDMLVLHNHGRTTEAQIEALNHCYVVGRGAFYCKHILAGDRRVLKMAYWEGSSLTKSFFKDLFAGRKFEEQRRLLWALLVGASARLAWNPRVRRI